jgi:hypothetical protein
LAISSISVNQNPEIFKPHRFSPGLKELVLMGGLSGSSDSPPRICLKACKAHHIKCTSIEHEEVSLIMVSQVHWVLKLSVSFYL